jgi:dTDP-4-amino-4,6-dideoxygalactose transaminase
MLANRYREVFAATSGLAFVDAPPGSESNFWLNAVRLIDAGLEKRDGLLKAANEVGYQCRPCWDLMHTLGMFGEMPRAEVSVSENLAATLINLPSSARLGRIGQ